MLPFKLPRPPRCCYWSAIYRGERNEGIVRIKDCVGAFGFITGFQYFSDISASMVIEVSEKKLQALFAELGSIVSLTEEKIENNSDTVDECVVYLNITFAQATGDMRNVVPAVPG